MLILNEQEVIYCQVVRHSLRKFDQLPGLAYNNRLFYQIESYGLTDYKAAVNRTRELFEQEKQQIIFLLVESANAYTIWRYDQQLIAVKKFNPKETFTHAGIFRYLIEEIAAPILKRKKTFNLLKF